jgi:predicted  nucleic acid-binding Zn-ribbon protein
MMDLEMADYERTVQILNGQITDRDQSITELQTEVKRLEDHNKVLKEQIGEF